MSTLHFYLLSPNEPGCGVRLLAHKIIFVSKSCSVKKNTNTLVRKLSGTPRVGFAWRKDKCQSNSNVLIKHKNSKNSIFFGGTCVQLLARGIAACVLQQSSSHTLPLYKTVQLLRYKLESFQTPPLHLGPQVSFSLGM